MLLSRFYETGFIEDMEKLSRLLKVRHEHVVGQGAELDSRVGTQCSSGTSYNAILVIIVPLHYFRQCYGLY